MNIDKEQLIDMYTKMRKIRRFEERAYQEAWKGSLPGLVHSYIGQEAIAVGVCANLRIDDRIVSNHRGHGHCIAKGADMKRMMAEIYGKKTGYCKGKGGSMHIADFGIGMLGADGIVGAGLPIATGAALATKLESGDKVAVVFFGDGACQEGEFHETLNLSSLWKLPLIFVCENNGYGVNTSVRIALAAKNVIDIPVGYGIPASIVDGNDVLAVHEAAQQAVARARAREGPSFLECKTYRWRHHFESDAIPDLRPKEEVESWKQKCPLAAFESVLLREGVLTEDMCKSIDREVLSQVQAAVDFAIESPLPEPRDALEDVFSA